MKNKKYHNVGTILKPSRNKPTTPLSEHFQIPFHSFTFGSTIAMQHPENKVIFPVIFYSVVP